MKIRELESNKDISFYIFVYTIFFLVVIAIISLVVWLVANMSNRYQEALDTCIDKGYSIEYCESLLN